MRWLNYFGTNWRDQIGSTCVTVWKSSTCFLSQYNFKQMLYGYMYCFLSSFIWSMWIKIVQNLHYTYDQVDILGFTNPFQNNIVFWACRYLQKLSINVRSKNIVEQFCCCEIICSISPLLVQLCFLSNYFIRQLVYNSY